MSGNCTYKAFMTGKTPIIITDCKSSLEAQNRAATVWNVKPKNRYKITVVLTEKDDKPVIHSGAEL